MTINIVQFQLPPGGASFGAPQFFGGDVLEPILAGDGDILRAGPRKLVIDGGSFAGLKAKFFGNFTYDGDEVFGHINRMKFFYDFGDGPEPFQVWRKVDWAVADVTEAIERFDAGEPDAIDIFVAEHDYRFVIHKTHFGPLMTTDQDDVVFSQSLREGAGVDYVFTFEGDDRVNLRKMGPENGTYIDTGRGHDTVFAGAGDDQIRSFAGRDVLKGGRGSDNIDGMFGRDKIFGQGGNDSYLSGGLHNDRIFGGRGNDEIRDDFGFNRMFGGPGDDNISGNGLLRGGPGDDTLGGLAWRKTDIFDFRLGKTKSFGDDKVNGNFSFSSKRVDTDEIWFDAGVDVTLQKVRNNVLLTAELDGKEIGTVRFNFEDVSNISDALVFI